MRCGSQCPRAIIVEIKDVAMPQAHTDDYAAKLEALITEVLLPGYIKYCRSNNVVPELQKLPEHIKPRAQPVCALLKPF